ncbi:Heterodisulfide reductase subunit C [Rhodospirillaceae bacterium LM-1]|nr:Heterodisulfide reductase subunit C [Rhodospirillaceae bacterium LM-1]
MGWEMNQDMSVRINSDKETRNFVAKVERISGQNLRACYQCGKCSAGCPMAAYMDVLPNQIIRLAQFGFEEELVRSEAIWTCVSCLTCNNRCPKGVKIAEVIEAVRQIVLRTRKDHMNFEKLPLGTLRNVPPIALIGSMRKFTS